MGTQDPGIVKKENKEGKKLITMYYFDFSLVSSINFSQIHMEMQDSINR